VIIEDFMGSINFENLLCDWYRTTNVEKFVKGRDKIDKVWDSTCDSILAKYIYKYGIFFREFFPDIKAEIEANKNVKIGNTGYECYFTDRVREIPDLKKIFIDNYNELKDKTLQCDGCNELSNYIFAGSYSARLKYPPIFCQKCSYYLRPYVADWDILRDRIRDFYKNIGSEKTCDICGKNYFINDFNNPQSQLAWENAALPIFHTNVFSSICPKCLNETCHKIRRKGKADDQLKKLYDLYQFLGTLPFYITYTDMFLLFRDREKILELNKKIRELWSAEKFEQVFGSIMNTLVKSGILKEPFIERGYGRLIYANDGHMCLSLAEKEIDDFLFSNNVKHNKEIYYPNSNYRCDWEVYINEVRYFIEYFGLMGIYNYTATVEEKKSIASKNNIVLIEIYPGTNWRRLLTEKLALSL
jgi:hypothetical protein